MPRRRLDWRRVTVAALGIIALGGGAMLLWAPPILRTPDSALSEAEELREAAPAQAPRMQALSPESLTPVTTPPEPLLEEQPTSGVRQRTRANRESSDLPQAIADETSSGAPSMKALQRRIDDLEQEVSSLAVAGTLDEADTETAQRILDKYRRDATRATSAAQQKKISEGLDSLERFYLKR